MKKIVMTAMAAATALSISSVQAADSVDIPLTGELAKSCDISAFLNGPFDAIDMTTTDSQGAESLSVNCNYGGSASVTFESDNAGKMVSGSNEVPYKFILTGSGSPFENGVSLATAQTWNGFPAVANTDQTRGMSIQLDSAATVAGTYEDTITATVQPN